MIQTHFCRSLKKKNSLVIKKMFPSYEKMVIIKFPDMKSV